MNTLMLGVTLSLLSAFGWGLSSILLKLSMKNKSAVTVNISRLYIISVVYAIFFTIDGNWKEILNLTPLQFLIAFISAQFGFVIGDYFFFNAMKIMGVSRTVPITSSYPLWAILWAYLFLGRSIDVQIILGAFLIVLAIIIVRQGEIEERMNMKGFMFALLAPLSWSFAIITMEWLSSQISAFTLAGLRMMLAALGISVFLKKYESEIKAITKREFAALTGAAFLGLFVGQYSFVKAVSLVGSSIAAPITAINPIISATLAILILKEPPNSKILTGLVMAVIGVVLISTA
ncbi:DMT family transporter [Thermococcus paralvinellae]|uniref:Putative drug/metabolite transporte n=1 Tax=Thermococcus paralvinellae TaxID=582419 RepID=W0I6I2_9EURY|nr:DMT family transporter [Thermococcus paralvinellae]AHF80347.1 putative drug/metabolite transporte [Thermococcus paralvinellae]